MLAHLLPKRTAILPRVLSRKMSTFGDHCPLLVSPTQLRDLLPAGGVTVVDASWHMPNVARNARKEYVDKHIPGARFLDLDEVASPHELGLKHMIPTGDVFASYCASNGITPSSHVVFYDAYGVFSAPRALFMFRALGHNRSSILNGGLLAWQDHGGSIESGEPSAVSEAAYPAPSLQGDVIRSYEQVATNAAVNPADEPIAELVLDARPHGRFTGADPEPRPGLSSGHIPFSKSLPFTTLLETHKFTPEGASDPVSYTTYKSSEGLLAALEDAAGPQNVRAILNGERGVITSCGSGMSACIIWLALKQLGTEKIALYDESWTGYAMRPASKIEKGE